MRTAIALVMAAIAIQTSAVPQVRYDLVIQGGRVMDPETGLGAATNPVVFYQPEYFVSRRVPSASYVHRYSEAVGLVEAGLVGFEGWMRTDCNLITSNASYVPAAILQAHS